MSSSILISLFVFSLIGVGGIAIYVALYGSHRVIEERFADLAVKIRASEGLFEDETKHDESIGRMLFKWASSRSRTRPDQRVGREIVRNVEPGGL